MEIGLPMSALS